jgi:hypothetical protein
VVLVVGRQQELKLPEHPGDDDDYLHRGEVIANAEFGPMPNGMNTCG